MGLHHDEGGHWGKGYRPATKYGAHTDGTLEHVAAARRYV